MGLGARLAHLAGHCRLAGRNLRRLPDRRRRVLLVRHAVDARMGAHYLVGDGLADARWQLDRYAEHQF